MQCSPLPHCAYKRVPFQLQPPGGKHVTQDLKLDPGSDAVIDLDCFLKEAGIGGQVDQVLQDVQRCGGGLQSQMDITSPNAPPLTNPQAPRSSWEPQAAPNSPNLIVLAAAYMVHQAAANTRSEELRACSCN
ncbi:hypothetical protein ABBQ32_009703 [Trebouxia sp. C0010 RCD-2024]